jgi:flagellar biosynthesis anti-sigma factor FlgM
VKVTGKKGSELKSVGFRKADAVKGSSVPKSGKAGSRGSGDDSSVAISERGRTVSEARRIYDSLPDVPQAEKVEALHAAVENGTYNVPGEVVADKMVNDAVKEIRNRNR